MHSILEIIENRSYWISLNILKGQIQDIGHNHHTFATDTCAQQQRETTIVQLFWNGINPISRLLSIITLLTAVSGLTTLQSCDPGDTSLVLINSTQSDVRYVYYSSFLEGDTLLPSCSRFELLEAGDTINVPIIGDWTEEFRDAEEGTVNWFFVDSITLDTADCTDIIQNNLILQRYDLTLDDIEKMNWEIIYSD